MILTSAILEVNLKNLRFNYNYLKYLNKGKYTGAVIKADAYGTGFLNAFKVQQNMLKITIYLYNLEVELYMTLIQKRNMKKQ